MASVLCLTQMAGESKRVHAWAGTELWLPFKDFSNMLHSPPYSVMLNCDSWQVRLSTCAPNMHSLPRTGQGATGELRV